MGCGGSKTQVEPKSGITTGSDPNAPTKCGKKLQDQAVLGSRDVLDKDPEHIHIATKEAHRRNSIDSPGGAKRIIDFNANVGPSKLVKNDQEEELPQPKDEKKRPNSQKGRKMTMKQLVMLQREKMRKKRAAHHKKAHKHGFLNHMMYVTG